MEIHVSPQPELPYPVTREVVSPPLNHAQPIKAAPVAAIKTKAIPKSSIVVNPDHVRQVQRMVDEIKITADAMDSREFFDAVQGIVWCAAVNALLGDLCELRRHRMAPKPKKR